MNVTCSAEPCPVILNAICVFYQGENLIYTGINTNDNLQTALEKIDAKFADASIGYIFNNGVIQTAPGQPVGLGGTLVQNTSINSAGYTLYITGSLIAGAHVTTGGTSNDFVKGDGSLDPGPYQPAGSYISALTGDGTATGPGSAVFTLTNVNFLPGTYGNATTIPIVTVNSKGLVTNVTPAPITFPAASLIFNGDVSGSGFTGSIITLTLNTVNSNIYGTNTPLKFAVNGKGLVTSAAPITALDIYSILGYTPVPNTRTITINGVTQDLSANRTWTIAVGTNGTSGTSGVNGTSGTSGTAGTSGYSGDRYRTTSTDCFTLGNAGTLTVAPGLGYSVAQSIIIVYDATNYQQSQVVSYNALTGVMVFTVPDAQFGSGTYCSWTVNLAGGAGGDGSSGTSGTSGLTGTSGTSGTSGVNGTSGSSGIDGTSGTSGVSGTSGTSGSSGYTTTEIAVSGTQDNVNKIFTLSQALTPGTAHQFYLNGQLLTYTEDYTISGTTLTISSTRPAPSPTDILRLFGTIAGSTCIGIPSGGTSGQVLTKISATNYDANWQDPNTGTAIAIGTPVTTGTPGSVLFVGVSGQLAQDNPNFFWADTSDRLGIGTNTPISKIHVAGTETAYTGVARGVYFNNTLTASANNDLLIGLDIDPVFDLAGKTGVQKYGLKTRNIYINHETVNTANLTPSIIVADASSTYFKVHPTTSYTELFMRGNNPLYFNWWFQIIQDYDTTFNTGPYVGNYYWKMGGAHKMNLKQSGALLIGTTTESGFGQKLDVVGSGRTSGKFTVGSAISGSAMLEASSTNQGFLPPRMTQAQRLLLRGVPTALYTLVGGSGYVDGTYLNKPLTGGLGYSLRGNFTVLGGAVTSCTINTPGDGYAPENILSVATSDIGGGTGLGFSIKVQTVNIAIGTMVYQTDGVEGLYIYKSTGWTFIA